MGRRALDQSQTDFLGLGFYPVTCDWVMIQLNQIHPAGQEPAYHKQINRLRRRKSDITGLIRDSHETHADSPCTLKTGSPHRELYLDLRGSAAEHHLFMKI
ncbi:hypothetical protein GOODEAATRI_032117 [Goodea atripinnis]|uniref:Uncharacterized protein n=1 Tax=Goodea atripinnis TaxID=208336 RepID=A0ABV0MMJ7_9TELE